MPKLVFYRQARVDAGIRTGIELEDETIFGRFEEGGQPDDPTLLWYVDLRCDGPAIPGAPSEARRWLLDREETIRGGFHRCATEFEAGRDVVARPLIWSRFAAVPEGVEMAIACATLRRSGAVSVPSLLIDVADHWRERIGQLAAVEWVA